MVDASGRRVIGRRAADSEGVAWVRGFKEGETQLRILDATSEWWKFPEHFGGKKLGYFACNSPHNDPDPTECIGCADPSERTQNRSFKYAFNALDKDGRVRVFKLGGKMRKLLLKREQTLGKDILQRRDIVIIRTGSGFGDTEYSYEWGEEYDLEDAWPDESQWNDLAEVVTESYWEAVRKQEAPDEDAEEEPADPEEGVDEIPVPEEPKPAKKTAAKKVPAKKVTAKREEPEPEPEVADVTPDEPGPDGELGESIDQSEVIEAAMERIKAMPDTDDIRQLLEDNGVEFGARAPRPRLLAIAEQAMIDGKLPTF